MKYAVFMATMPGAAGEVATVSGPTGDVICMPARTDSSSADYDEHSTSRPKAIKPHKRPEISIHTHIHIHTNTFARTERERGGERERKKAAVKRDMDN